MSMWSGRSLATLRLLSEIGGCPLEECDLSCLYDQIVKIALAEVQADQTMLMLWDGVSDQLTLAAAGVPLDGACAASVSLDSSISGWVVTRCEPLSFDTSVTSPAFMHLLYDRNIYAAIGVPLIGRGRALGALIATRQRAKLPFTLADRDLLVLLASQVALAIEEVQIRTAILQELSERQQIAQQSAQTEKLVGMGRLTASIAHEINNPLHAIVNSLHLLLSRAMTEEKRELYLGMAREEVERLITIVQRMLHFYQPLPEGMRPVGLHALLEHVLRTTAEQFERSGVVVERDWGEGLPRVMGIASHLKQVFLNLAQNAIEAMPKGGRLVVRTRAVDGQFGGSPQAVQVEFIDNGLGIPDSALQTIFEPFYTTKSSSTGLGLAISYSIVEQHGGKLSVRSDPAQTIFRVLLPALIRSPAPTE